MRIIEAILRGLRTALLAVAALPLGLLEGIAGSMQSKAMPKPVRKAGERLDERRQARLARRYARAVRDGKPKPDISKLDWRFSTLVSGLDATTAPLVAQMKSRDMISAVSRLGKAAETPVPTKRSGPPRKTSTSTSAAPWRIRRERPKPMPCPEPVVDVEPEDEPKPSGPRL